MKKQISGKGAVRAGKGFTLFISNENIKNIIRIIKSWECSNLLIDCITETVQHEIKQQKFGFLPALLAYLAASLVKPVISSIINGISGISVRRAGREYMDKIF